MSKKSYDDYKNISEMLEEATPEEAERIRAFMMWAAGLPTGEETSKLFLGEQDKKKDK